MIGVGVSLLAVHSSLYGVQGGGFENLNFERFGSPSIPPDSIWLSWNLAAPAWSHPQGGDSFFVYHKAPPQDNVGQYYFLADSFSTRWSPLQGEFSLVLVSGNYDRNDPASSWVNASIEQAGVVPNDARSFQFMADGAFDLQVNSESIPVASLGGSLFAADISQYAGQSIDLRIVNADFGGRSGLVLDALAFSPLPIPEPSVAGLLTVSGLVWILRRRRFGLGKH